MKARHLAMVAAAAAAGVFPAVLREGLRRVPAMGIIGEDALREAFAGDYMALAELLRGKLKQLFKLEGDQDPWPYVRALFEDSLVVERNGKLLRYPYTVDGVDVTFGEPSEVVVTYADAKPKAMKEAVARVLFGGAADSGVFLEAKDEADATVFRIRVIRAGLSGNARYYPDAVLREAVPLFENCRVFVKSDEEHLAGKGKDVRNLVGRLENVTFVEGKSPDTGEVLADFRLLQPKGTVAAQLREAWSQGMANLFGFSIDAQGLVRRKTVQGKRIVEAVKLAKVTSVDLIVEPGAGGEIVKLVEAREEKKFMERDELIALIEAQRPDLLRGKDVSTLTDAQLASILREAVGQQEEAGAGHQVAAGASRAITQSGDTVAVARMVEARVNMRGLVRDSGLPDFVQNQLLTLFEARPEFTEDEVREAIKEWKTGLGPHLGGGQVRGLGDHIRVEAGESRHQKVVRMIEAFFDPTHKDHRHSQSIKNIYVAITGDHAITGMRRNCDQALMREALDSSTLDDVLGDGIARRMVAEYNAPTVQDGWRSIADVVPVTDFRTQDRTRWGGYGDLPQVAEGNPYMPLDTPTDEKASYGVTKRGGTEELTLEMITNDDVGVVRRIPVKLARSAKRTLSKFVFDFARNNPVIYDGLTFFHANHGNLLAVACDSAGWAAARLAMLKMTEAGSNDRLAIPPKFLLVPFEQEEAARDTFKRDTNVDETFIQSLKPTILPVWYWDDPNDWVAFADPKDIPTIEIGFLNNQQEPEIFVQDSPNGGSLFSHDKITYKIRHIYGGVVTDYRGAIKSVQANP